MSFLNRLREPSTWAGLGGIALAMGANPDKVNVTSNAIAGLLAALAVFLPERNNTPQQ